MKIYEAPELLAVGTIAGVVLGEKDFMPQDNPSDTTHLSQLSVIDVD